MTDASASPTKKTLDGSFSPLLTGLSQTLGNDILKRIQTSRILLVGSGGIGCELLKNFALSGFRHVEVIDLDTIDVSNLNRQFLFRSRHVGMPKCVVACEAALQMCPSIISTDSAASAGEKAQYIPRHGDVCDNGKFNVTFVKGFDVVVNALDNVVARRRVNRLCLAASVPLVEAGTTGYIGQVTVIDRPSKVECYECQPKPTQKVYPVCTIRSTPSRPVHCIVWAKELYRLLFGSNLEESMLYEAMDGSDTTGNDDHGEKDTAKEEGEKSTYMDIVEKLRPLLRPHNETATTKKKEKGDDILKTAQKLCSDLFVALFSTEVKKQLDMGRYETAQKVPTPLGDDIITNIVSNISVSNPDSSTLKIPPSKQSGYRTTDIWSSVEDCIAELSFCLLDTVAKAHDMSPSNNHEQNPPFEFDKDDDMAMRLVTSSSNLRQAVFGIEPSQSVYSAKGIAGNIIPAIATTNAIVAGLQVLQVFHILKNQLENKGKEEPTEDRGLKEYCRYINCNRNSTRNGIYLVPTKLSDPNPDCFVCRNATVSVSLNTAKWTLQMLLKRIIKKELGFAEPTVLVNGDIIHEEGEGADEGFAVNMSKTLEKLPAGGIQDGSVVSVEDFTQDLEVDLCFVHKVDWDGMDKQKKAQGEELGDEDEEERFIIGGSRPVAAATTSASAANTKEKEQNKNDDEDDDDILIVSDAPNLMKSSENADLGTKPAASANGRNKKRRQPDESDDVSFSKKKKIDAADIQVVELD